MSRKSSYWVQTSDISDPPSGSDASNEKEPAPPAGSFFTFGPRMESGQGWSPGSPRSRERGFPLAVTRSGNPLVAQLDQIVSTGLLKRANREVGHLVLFSVYLCPRSVERGSSRLVSYPAGSRRSSW